MRKEGYRRHNGESALLITDLHHKYDLGYCDDLTTEIVPGACCLVAYSRETRVIPYMPRGVAVFLESIQQHSGPALRKAL